MNPKTDEYVQHKHSWVIDPFTQNPYGVVLLCPECGLRSVDLDMPPPKPQVTHFVITDMVNNKYTVKGDQYVLREVPGTRHKPPPAPRATPGGWVMFWLTAALLLGIAMLCCSCEGVEAPPTYRHDGLAEMLRQSEPTYELHEVIRIPSSGYYLANPGHEIAVYVCDPAYLHGDGWRGYLVLRGGLAVFLASGRSPAYYKAVASALQAELPHVRCLDAFVGPDAPEGLLEALKGNP